MSTQSIYVIASENGPVKIGFSRSPKKRLSKLRTGCFSPIYLAYSEEAEGDIAGLIERRAHDILQAHRRHGEWFSVSPEEAIAAIKRAAVEIASERISASEQELRRRLVLEAIASKRFLAAVDVRYLLNVACNGNQRTWAIEHGVSPQYVNDTVRGRREPGAAILKALGLERVTVYRQVKP